jgi:hypothetical protein
VRTAPFALIRAAADRFAEAAQAGTLHRASYIVGGLARGPISGPKQRFLQPLFAKSTEILELAGTADLD